MKKVIAIILPFILTVTLAVSVDAYNKNLIDSKYYETTYYGNDLRNRCPYCMDNIIKDNTLMVFGSSEFAWYGEHFHPKDIFNRGYSDFNLLLYGRGNTQSLQHAIDAGAYANRISNNKVVLILSPQWFTERHLSSENFSSVFKESVFVDFLKNESISEETKLAVLERTKTLLAADKECLKRVEDYESIYINGSTNPFKRFRLSLHDLVIEANGRFKLAKKLNSREEMADFIPDFDNYVNADKIDFKVLLDYADQVGRELCANNDYGIDGDYFTTYIKDKYESFKDSAKEDSFSKSREYDDLRLFLDVCRDTGLEPLIISIPVNGYWYDYTGFPKSDREQYYQNIRDICKEYDVELLDYSVKEYEKYFFKDNMHIGWKGWVHISEEAYKFYKK